jgi:hypothetical protein
MALRAALVSLIVAATAAFIIGTAIERSFSGESAHHGTATTAPSSSETGAGEASQSQMGAESASERAAEGAGTSGAPATEAGHAELRPLGIDVEAWPFVAVAVLASLALAAAVWLRPRAAWLFGLVAVAMLAFAALDVREVVHQLDISKDGLAALAGVVAALHLAAAAVSGVMASRLNDSRGMAGPAGTMAA